MFTGEALVKKSEVEIGIQLEDLNSKAVSHWFVLHSQFEITICLQESKNKIYLRVVFSCFMIPSRAGIKSLNHWD